ncbi:MULTISPECIES: DUF4824 family protein [unclassified Pseudomonas]|uniref:DUF4824 family protein n=1 Tax=unclassified Pseudomonas TaxID=196821 RepID=UPI00244BD80E|nr:MULTISPECIES: DUF4824 family protein [unclassified Pseudomonas]MDG9924242.1 DUF4824 family protein [Pseudomonas sp. GD04045]MDH0033283.1 DUF4824 family protein [Pseudomonas sp. GD04019]
MSARLVLSAGLGLILLSNAVALAGVWYNRQGEPESQLLLTERELQRNWDGPRRENSGLSMRLNWRMQRLPSSNGQHCYAEQGLEAAQLHGLGFTQEETGQRQGWVVLELAGDAYRLAMQQAEQRLRSASENLAGNPQAEDLQHQERAAREHLQNERTRESRLFVVDVGSDVEALRQRYPERSRYALLRGTVRAWSDCQQTTLRGSVSDLSADEINVPHVWRRQLGEYLPHPYDISERPFQMQISFGQRLEPWISAVEIADKTSKRDDENGAPR